VENVVSAGLFVVKFYLFSVSFSCAGMKVLLLDAATTKFVSMVYSQTQILEQEVYLVERLGKAHESMGHLKAAVFLQPTEDNCVLLLSELANPKYAEYHLFFSNIVPQDILARLARADEGDLIKQVQEYYGDFAAVNEDLFHTGVWKSISIASLPARTLDSAALMDRNVSGVLSALLATKRKPAQIRYQATSETARRLASDVVLRLGSDDIFEFRGAGPLLLILDRRDDPITPLLTQWTYQAMVHELLGLKDNRVVLKDRPGLFILRM
jgi:vacuolar protein sorting-associated protein 45